MATKKMSSKELVHDRVQDTLYSALLYIKKHALLIGLIIMAIIAVGLGIWFYGYLEQSYRLEVSTAFETLEPQLAEQPSTGRSVAIADFMKDYGQTVYGVSVLWQKVKDSLAEQDWDAAKELYEEIIKHPLSLPQHLVEAKLGLAKYWEKQGETDKVLEAIQSINEEGYDDVKEYALGSYKAAQGDLAAAKEHFEKVSASVTSGNLGRKAKQMLEFIP